MEIEMAEFTYEEKDIKTSLEYYEWDNIWWQNAPDTEKPRVLIVGDSITCGYRDFVNKELCGEIYADGYASSKGVDNPYIPAALDLMIAQSNPSLITINYGLHGWHLSDEQYKENYIKVLNYLREKYPEKKMVIVLTTPVRVLETYEINEERTERVKARNAVAVQIAQQFGLDVIDLFSLIIDHKEFWKDEVHLHSPGYEKIAGVVADYIRKNI